MCEGIRRMRGFGVVFTACTCLIRVISCIIFVNLEIISTRIHLILRRFDSIHDIEGDTCKSVNLLFFLPNVVSFYQDTNLNRRRRRLIFDLLCHSKKLSFLPRVHVYRPTSFGSL